MKNVREKNKITKNIKHSKIIKKETNLSFLDFD